MEAVLREEGLGRSWTAACIPPTMLGLLGMDQKAGPSPRTENSLGQAEGAHEMTLLPAEGPASYCLRPAVGSAGGRGLVPAFALSAQVAGPLLSGGSGLRWDADPWRSPHRRG